MNTTNTLDTINATLSAPRLTKSTAERALRALIPEVRALELRAAGDWWVVDARYGLAMTLYYTAPTLEQLVEAVGESMPARPVLARR